jgi:ABC-2 type transport system permease protein
MIRILALRELRSLLSMPSTWFVLAVLQFIFAWFFLARLDAYLELQPQFAQIANAPGVTASVAAPLFNVIALLLMMLIPMFTMRLIAEERRNQTLSLLLSSPLSSAQIVLGKFFGLMLFLVVLIASAPLMLYTLQLGTPLDHGLLWSNVVGLLLLAACYAALGLYISALTGQPWRCCWACGWQTSAARPIRPGINFHRSIIFKISISDCWTAAMRPSSFCSAPLFCCWP